MLINIYLHLETVFFLKPLSCHKQKNSMLHENMEKECLFHFWYGAEADVSKKWTTNSLCVVWINESLPAKPNVVTKPLFLINQVSCQWLPRNQLYGRLMTHPCILPNCNFIHSKGQIPISLCFKTNAYSFLKQLFSPFSPRSRQGLISDVDYFEGGGFPAPGEGISGLASHHSNGDINLAYF